MISLLSKSNLILFNVHPFFSSLSSFRINNPLLGTKAYPLLTSSLACKRPGGYFLIIWLLASVTCHTEDTYSFVFILAKNMKIIKNRQNSWKHIEKKIHAPLSTNKKFVKSFLSCLVFSEHMSAKHVKSNKR